MHYQYDFRWSQSFSLASFPSIEIHVILSMNNFLLFLLLLQQQTILTCFSTLMLNSMEIKHQTKNVRRRQRQRRLRHSLWRRQRVPWTRLCCLSSIIFNYELLYLCSHTFRYTHSNTIPLTHTNTIKHIYWM